MGKLRINAISFGDKGNRGVNYYHNGYYIGYSFYYPSTGVLFKSKGLQGFIEKHGL